MKKFPIRSYVHYLKIIKCKVFPLESRLWPREWVEVKLYSTMTKALERDELSVVGPGRTLPPGKDMVPIAQEAVWAPGPVWTGGKSRPTRIRSSDHPARSQSLYRLNYPAHFENYGLPKQNFTVARRATLSKQASSRI